MAFITFLLQTFVICATLINLSIAGYTLEDDYEPSNFFSKFDFFTSSDPTNGYVTYVDQGTASSEGLITTASDSVYIGVDHTNVASGSGRSSVRLTSTKSYSHGLIIADIAHMPGGICGTWPAFWTVGPNWPADGEIDIIEGVNQQSQNDMTLHTSSGCSITNNNAFTGAITTANCDVNAAGQSTNAGCQIAASAPNTFGTGFNAAGGGVYATEWTSNAISIWFFTRGAIPSDVSSGTPDPTTWGTPVAQFQGGCNIDTYFQSQQIVFDNTFCGDWAGNVWSSGSCASQASTCQEFVQNNPSAFADAFWTVNSLKVYQESGSSADYVVPSNATTSSQAVAVSTASSVHRANATTASAVSSSSSSATASPSVSLLQASDFPSPDATGTPGASVHRRHNRHLREHKRHVRGAGS
ncbi:MAG: hypothetical protein M1827_004692 [Pycnora praestabilis]|nr:MAG: hypothetical protein M1827_004692 [Pycnora praestabilis]